MKERKDDKEKEGEEFNMADCLSPSVPHDLCLFKSEAPLEDAGKLSLPKLLIESNLRATKLHCILDLIYINKNSTW